MSWLLMTSSVALVFQGDIGLNVAQMIVELIRDNRKIVDRITQDQIEMFVGLLRLNKVPPSRPISCLVISKV